MSPSYFFYEMTIRECEVYLEGLNLREQSMWEKVRMLMYSIVQVNSAKEIEPSDVISFAWDKDNEEDNEINEQEVERIKQMMKKYEFK